MCKYGSKMRKRIKFQGGFGLFDLLKALVLGVFGTR